MILNIVIFYYVEKLCTVAEPLVKQSEKSKLEGVGIVKLEVQTSEHL